MWLPVKSTYLLADGGGLVVRRDHPRLWHM